MYFSPAVSPHLLARNLWILAVYLDEGLEICKLNYVGTHRIVPSHFGPECR